MSRKLRPYQILHFIKYRDDIEHQILLKRFYGVIVYYGVLISSVIVVSIQEPLENMYMLSIIFWVLLAYLFADLFTGAYHFMLDNFKLSFSRTLSAQAKAFQDHHYKNDLAGRKYFDLVGPAVPAAVVVTTLSFMVPLWAQTFMISFAFISLNSQYIHKLAHAGNSAPKWFRLAVRFRLILSPKQHRKHHKPPFITNYSIVNGYTNHFIDSLKVYPFFLSVLNKERYLELSEHLGKKKEQ